MAIFNEYISNETPAPGDFICINGGETLGLVVGLGPSEFIKAASVRKNGRRQTAYYLPEVLTMPEPSIAGMIRFYDTCTGFYDGSAGAEGESVELIERFAIECLISPSRLAKRCRRWMRHIVASVSVSASTTRLAQACPLKM